MPFHSPKKTVRERITELFFDYASNTKGKTFDNICKVVIPLSVIKTSLSDIPDSTIEYNMRNKKAFRRVFLGTAQAYQIVLSSEKSVIKTEKRTKKQIERQRKKFDEIKRMADLRKKIAKEGLMKIFKKRIESAVARCLPHFKVFKEE